MPQGRQWAQRIIIEEKNRGKGLTDRSNSMMAKMNEGKEGKREQGGRGRLITLVSRHQAELVDELI